MNTAQIYLPRDLKTTEKKVKSIYQKQQQALQKQVPLIHFLKKFNFIILLTIILFVFIACEDIVKSTNKAVIEPKAKSKAEPKIVSTINPALIKIYTWQDLQAMRNNLAGNYILMQDISFPALGKDGFSRIGFDPIGRDESEHPINKDEESPKEFLGRAFSGSLDGNGKTITGLVIRNNRLNYAGLFGRIQAADKDAVVVKNLILVDVKIIANAVAGALAGELDIGTIENVHVRRSTEDADVYVETRGYTYLFKEKLLGGYRYPRFRDIWLSSTGGLVGAVSKGGSLLLSSSAADVSARGNYTGGLVGESVGIVSGFATGEVKSTASYVGGLVGYAGRLAWTDFGSTTGYATGNVIGTRYVGGLVGYNDSPAIGYAAGDVTGTSRVGGLVGYNVVLAGTATGYAIGDVISVTEKVRDLPYTNDEFGGLVGQNTTTAIGYARGVVYKKDVGNKFVAIIGGERGFGLFAGGVHDGRVLNLGYHSSGESRVEPFILARSGVDGDAITVTATSPVASTAFSHLTFGDKIGEWTWAPGRWPAINIGAVQVASEQPTRPSVATLPPAAVTITKGTTSTASALVIDWEAGTLEVSHLTNRGKVLIAAQIKYKVYVVAKTVGSDRTAQQVRDAVTTPTEVAAGVTTATIDSVTAATAYEVVVEAINTTDNTKKSLSVVVMLNTDA